LCRAPFFTVPSEGRFRTDEKAAAPAMPPIDVECVQFVVWLNRWPSFASDSGCRVPIDAAARAFSGPTKKATPPEPRKGEFHSQPASLAGETK